MISKDDEREFTEPFDLEAMGSILGGCMALLSRATVRLHNDAPPVFDVHEEATNESWIAAPKGLPKPASYDLESDLSTLQALEVAMQCQYLMMTIETALRSVARTIENPGPMALAIGNAKFFSDSLDKVVDELTNQPFEIAIVDESEGTLQ